MKELIKEFNDEKSMHRFELLEDRTVNVVIGDFHMTQRQFELYSNKEDITNVLHNNILDAFVRIENKYMKRGKRVLTSLDGIV